MTPIVAAFDVDGTLTTRDCVVPFMRRVAGTPRIAARLLIRPDRIAPAIARRDRDRVKELASAAAFRGRPVAEIGEQASSYARHVFEHWMRSDTLSRLHAHRDAGDRVVLVSASFETYLRPLGKLLGVDDVLATRLADRDGVLTGELIGSNCRGPEKVRRLHEWVRSRHESRADVRIVAYGDSAGDREMLADADEAHWVDARGVA